MIEIARLPLDQDLGPFLEWLNRQGVASRVVESDGMQALVIVNSELKAKVLEALREVGLGRRAGASWAPCAAQR